MPNSINLKTDFELPASAWSYRKEHNNMTIIAEAVCMGQARKLCSDIEAALEYGAYPAAHAVMIDKINEANREKQALAVTLEYRG